MIVNVSFQNDRLVRTLFRSYPKQMRTAVAMGLGRTAQQAADLLRSDEFLGGISAQLNPSRKSVGRGLTPPGVKKKQSQRYDSDGPNGVQLLPRAPTPNNLHYTVGTNFIGARVHEFGAVIRPKTKKALAFQVPTAFVVAKVTPLKRGGFRRTTLKTPVPDQWTWVFAKQVTIPSRPAWRDVFNRVHPNTLPNIVTALRQYLRGGRF